MCACRCWSLRRHPGSVSALASALLLVGSTTFGQSQRAGDRFDRYDTNRDGTLTREEMNDDVIFDRLLQRLDQNRDGVLQRDELRGADLGRERDQQDAAGRLSMPPDPPHSKHLGIRYADLDGVDPNLLSLDLYVPSPEAGGPAAPADSPATPADLAEQAGRPVLIMIHGGGWRRGDKSGQNMVGAKMRHFVGEGYIYITINYRLTTARPGTTPVQHPVHVEDCARAIAWVHDHVADYGGDPDRIHLMGHSAGAHLAGLVATNDRFLKSLGKDLSIIRTNVLLDTAALDIPWYLERQRGRGMTSLYHAVFGTDAASWRDASPALQIEAGKSIPPTLIFYAGERMALHIMAPKFAESLTAAGSPAQAVDTVNLSHEAINARIGMVGDPMTQLIMRLHAGEDPTGFPTELTPAEQPSTDVPGSGESEPDDDPAEARTSPERP